MEMRNEDIWDEDGDFTLETPSLRSSPRSEESRSFPKYRNGIISAGLLAPAKIKHCYK